MKIFNAFIVSSFLLAVECFHQPGSFHHLLKKKVSLRLPASPTGNVANKVPPRNSFSVAWPKSSKSQSSKLGFGLKMSSKDISPTFKATIASAILLVKNFAQKARRLLEGAVSAEPALPLKPYQSLILWASIFLFTCMFYCAENAIGKISPWTVKQFAEEEGPNSPFGVLDSSEAVTRMFITVLLTTTALDIYNQTLFVTTMAALFPHVNIALFAVTLTIITLFFGELMPKAIAATKPEPLVRWLVPPLHKLSLLLSPITKSLIWLSDALIWSLGLKTAESNSVTENILRLVVDEAQRTESIQSGEGRMIKGVLDMENKEVSKIMRPRVDIIAVAEEDSVLDIVRVATEHKYSRIPVYRGSVDHIVGVVFSKDILDFIATEDDKNTKNDWLKLTAKDLMDPTHYIPETMNCWNALQDMRKKRLHMSIVVDEYGGTAGLVTLEDILEEVVGEIYDEDDNEERVDNAKNIFKGKDGSYKMKGFAQLAEVCEALQIDLVDEEEKLGSSLPGEYSTIGGLLCSLAGRIPRSGAKIRFANYVFTILKVEDTRRIHEVLAEPVKPTAIELSSADTHEVHKDVDSFDSPSVDIVYNDENGFEADRQYSSGDESDLEMSTETVMNSSDIITPGNDLLVKSENNRSFVSVNDLEEGLVGPSTGGHSFIDHEWVKSSTEHHDSEVRQS